MNGAAFIEASDLAHLCRRQRAIRSAFRTLLLQKLGRMNAELLRQTRHHHETRIALTPLDAPQVGHINIGVAPEFFLAQAAPLPELQNIRTNDGPPVHAHLVSHSEQRAAVDRGSAKATLFPRSGLALEELAGLDADDGGQLLDHVEAGAVDASLERADISSVDPGVCRERFLGQAGVKPITAQIPRKNFAKGHAGKATALRCIQPRSILDNW
jgi:hypothetical protein